MKYNFEQNLIFAQFIQNSKYSVFVRKANRLVNIAKINIINVIYHFIHWNIFRPNAFVRKAWGDLWSFFLFWQAVMRMGERSLFADQRPSTRRWESVRAAGKSVLGVRHTNVQGQGGAIHHRLALRAFSPLYCLSTLIRERVAVAAAAFVSLLREAKRDCCCSCLSVALLRGSRSDWIYATRAVYLIQNMATHQGTTHISLSHRDGFHWEARDLKGVCTSLY